MKKIAFEKKYHFYDYSVVYDAQSEIITVSNGSVAISLGSEIEFLLNTSKIKNFTDSSLFVARNFQSHRCLSEKDISYIVNGLLNPKAIADYKKVDSTYGAYINRDYGYPVFGTSGSSVDKKWLENERKIEAIEDTIMGYGGKLKRYYYTYASAPYGSVSYYQALKNMNEVFIALRKQEKKLE